MSDETKAILKEAYQLLRQKEYSSVVKKCKKILRRNENHFDALLVLACAMLNLDEHKLQVPMVLERAMQIKPDSPKPWQGLITYYEENLDNNESRNKLISSYCKLLQIDSNKLLHNLNKILEVSSQIKDDTVLGQSVESLYELRKKLDDEQMKMVNATLAEIIVHSFGRLNNHQDLMESVLSSVVNDTGASNRQNYYGKYLKVLYDKHKSDIVIKEAVNMHRQFPNDKLPLEYICCVYYEHNILNNNCYEDVNIKQYYESLMTLEKDSHDAAVAQAVHLKKTNDLLTARQILKNILAIKPRLLYGWITLSEISVRLYCWEDAENAMRQAMKLVNNNISNESLYKMELILIESLSRSSKPQKWKAALQMCADLLNRHPSTQADLLYARIHILLDDPEVSLNKLQDLESKDDTKIQASLLRALYFKHQNQLDFAIEAVNLALELPEAWLLLGSVHYEREQYNHSLMAFLNGVTADQFNWECLVYLGHYYREHGNDLERSRRCYLKALQINPNSEEAGIGLSTVYRLLKNYSANMQLLERLTAEDSGPKWAWFQLGKQYLDQEDGLQAIKAFQRVIRADPNNSDNWEALGDAYFIRGAYTSALRSYQRALELCPTLLYSLTQLATIKLILEQYTEAKHDFEQILVIKPQYISALKGLAEVCIALANESATKQFLGRVNDYLQQALTNLSLAITERNDMSCLWKLLGDVCYKVALLPEKYNSLSVPSKLIKNDDSEGVAWLKRRDLFLLSTRNVCYCCALSISPQTASLWHDLASCYLMQLKFDPTVDHKTLASKCLAVGKHAVKLCPSTWLHWNLLGVICMSPHVKNYALAQHSYVMAIDRELNNPVVWCNLGTLYLHIGDLYKANEAYSQAQRADPAYINSWIGQAIIAEMMARKEAIDLFRHSTQLGYHNEAALGYAHWVLTVLLTADIEKDSAYTYIIENMHALFVASDVMTWYLEYHPEDCYARNAYGLLLERQKLYRSSAEQFAIAIHTNVPEEKDAVCLNLGRVLIQLKKYSEAIKLFEAVRRVNYNSQCHLALSLYKAGKYEESYSAYETTLHSFAKSETEKAYTLCAMAAIAYTFQGVHDAKTLLFQSIQIQPQVVTSFLAAAALGILHGDLNLTTLILNELKSYESHRDYGHHVANLTAYFHLIKNDVKGAVSTLSKAIFNYPDDVRYWIQLLRILLETDVHSFSRCAQKALFLNRNIVNTNAVHVACASSFNYFEESSESDPRCSVRSAQKLLFTYPDSVESWATFIVACLPRPSNKNINCDAEWLAEFILVTQRNHKCTASMAKWLDDNKTRLTQYIDLKTMS